jgi:hypothetical protein
VLEAEAVDDDPPTTFRGNEGSVIMAERRMTDVSFAMLEGDSLLVWLPIKDRSWAPAISDALRHFHSNKL